MELNWNLSFIKKCKKNLELERQTKNNFMYKFYCKTLFEKDGKLSLDSIGAKDTEVTIECIVNEFKKYIKMLPKSIASQVLVLLEEYQNSNLLKCESYLIEDDASNEELHDKSYEIYLSLGKEYKKDLDFIYKKGLVFVDRNLKALLDSCCFMDSKNRVGFVYLDTLAKDFTLISALNHELAHSISAMRNPKLCDKKKYALLTELPSIFMDFYTANTEYEKTKEIKHIESSINYINYFKEIIERLSYINEISKLNTINKKTINNMLKKKFNRELTNYEEFIDDITFYSTENDITYLVSALFASHMLLSDEEKTKYCFKETLNEDNDTILRLAKKIDFDTKDPANSFYLFNELDCSEKTLIRKYKK